MPAVIASADLNNPSNTRLRLVTVTADAAYPTGGYDISTAIPVSGAVAVLPTVRYVGAAAGLVAAYNPATKKLVLLESTTGAPNNLIECAASSAHVTTSTIIDVLVISV